MARRVYLKDARSRGNETPYSARSDAFSRGKNLSEDERQTGDALRFRDLGFFCFSAPSSCESMARACISFQLAASTRECSVLPSFLGNYAARAIRHALCHAVRFRKRDWNLRICSVMHYYRRTCFKQEYVLQRILWRSVTFQVTGNDSGDAEYTKGHATIIGTYREVGKL